MSSAPLELDPPAGRADGSSAAEAGASAGGANALLAGVKPEQALGGAFAGGILAALLLRRLRS